MSQNHRRRWRFALGLGAGLTLGTLLPGLAADAPAPAQSAPAEIRLLTLPECLQLACEQQPNVIAARASLASASTQLHALERLHVPPLLPGGRELPYRIKQATLGVCIAQAALDQAEYDAAYAVRRTYLAVQYAQAQLTVTNDLVKPLETYNAIEARLLDDEEARIQARAEAGQVVIYYRLARSRHEEAVNGVGRALAALREAVGLPPDVCIRVPDEGWFRVEAKGEPPFMHVTLCKGDVVALALARRGEAAQTATLADIHQLEVDAQGASCLSPTVRTFAAGADIHARPVPPAFDDGAGAYRPGALAPEMPPFLIGGKCDRQARAQDLADRAVAVAAKTRNLIALEAEDAYWRWLETHARSQETYKAALATLVLQDEKYLKALDNTKVKVQDLVFAAQGRAAYNEAIYHYLISLAALERVTAGGFCSGLGGPVPPASAAP